MSIQDKRIELTVLIDSIKEHSDQLSRLEVIPFLELSVILSKISQLQERAAVLKYLISQEPNKQENILDNSSSEENSAKEMEEKQPNDVSKENESLVDELEEFETKEEEEISSDESEANLMDNEPREKQSAEEKEEIAGEKDVKDTSAVVEPLQQATTSQEETEPEENPDGEELSNQEEENDENDEELAYSPSFAALDAVLEEVKEDHSLQEATTSTNEPSHEELMKKIEKEVELSAAPDLNEALSEKDKSLSNQLQKQPIADLLAVIGLNERYLYSNELFHGDMDEFKNAIKMLNEFETGEEARAFFENGLRASYDWADDNVLAQALFSLVERRFQ